MSFSSAQNHKDILLRSDKDILQYVANMIAEIQQLIQDNRFRIVFDLLEDARLKTLQAAEGVSGWGTTTSLPLS